MNRIIALLLGLALAAPAVAFAETDTVNPAPGGDDLLEVYRQAVSNDPQIRRARAERDAALETRPQARSQLLPSLSLFAEYQEFDREDRNDPMFDADGSTTSYGIRLNQPIFDAPAIARLRQAGAVVARAESEYAAARQDLIVRAAEAYLDVLLTQDSLDFAQAEKAAIERQMQQARQQFEVGVIAITGVQEAQAAHDLATAREIEARRELMSAREQLRELTGMYAEALRPLQDEIPLATPEPLDVEAWVEGALRQNLQLQAARLSRDAASSELSSARGERLPRVDLTARMQRVDTDSPQPGLPDSEYDETAFGVQMTVPLFAGGAINSRIREATAEQEQARQGAEQQQRAVERLTRDAFLGLESSASQVRALRQAVRSNQTALESVEAGLEAGTRTNVEVLDARRELFRARRDFANARYQYVLNTLRLKQAAGTLGPDDLEEVNSWLR